jgi:hypothetical protein
MGLYIDLHVELKCRVYVDHIDLKWRADGRVNVDLYGVLWSIFMAG